LTDLGYSERNACRVVGMNRSTYRQQKTRHPSNREVRRILLADTITELHLASRSTYGARRMRAALFHERGLVVNYKLIRRIMVDQGLSGLPTRKKGRRNLVNAATSEDLVNRNFTAPASNALWLTDITEHKTREGTLYCCVVLDQFSRRVVGWAIDRRNEATLVNDALTMAARSRATSPNTILHSDHGSQGGFNWSSQHLVMTEVCDGTWQEAVARGANRCQAAVGGGSGLAPTDAFARAA
jgi:putative transposase